jgi:hypothetical protein
LTFLAFSGLTYSRRFNQTKVRLFSLENVNGALPKKAEKSQVKAGKKTKRMPTNFKHKFI